MGKKTEHVKLTTWLGTFLGARLRGRTGTRRSKKGSEKGSGKGLSVLRRAFFYGFYSKKGF